MEDEGWCFDDGDGVISAFGWWGGRVVVFTPALIVDFEGQCRGVVLVDGGCDGWVRGGRYKG